MKRTWPRWVFLSLVAGALVYLIFVIRTILVEADTTFGAAAQLSSTSLKSMVVHLRPFTPPADSLLRSANLHVIERITWGLDTINPEGVDVAWRRRRLLASVLNEHSVSLEEYRWIRTMTLNALRVDSAKGTVHRADSINAARMRMIGPIIRKHIQPLIRNDDQEAL